MLTFITPVAPEHVEALQRAIDSVHAQSVPCRHLVAVDEDRRGPAHVRNTLLKQVTTPFVSFLDADDTIDPNFAKLCLKAMPHRGYVYTDWLLDGKHTEAPNKAWCGGTWHLITSVLRTADARAVGGFDETLSALEDTDFWLKIVTRQICGVRVAKPLVQYSKSDVSRSTAAHNSGRDVRIKAVLHERYKNKMGCCGGQAVPDVPQGDKQAGDVLALALWQGNRRVRGQVTRRRYPRTSYPRTLWVSPLDINAMPAQFEVIEAPAVDDPLPMEQTGVRALAQALADTGPYETATDNNTGPNWSYVLDAAKERLT